MSYSKTVEKIENALNGDGIFVFDTSSIYAIHCYPKTKFEDIVDKLIEHSERYYYTSQLKYELTRNKKKKPIISQIRKYVNRNNAIVKNLSSSEKKLQDEIRHIEKLYTGRRHVSPNDIYSLKNQYQNLIKDIAEKRETLISGIDRIDLSDKLKEENIPDFFDWINYFEYKWIWYRKLMTYLRKSFLKLNRKKVIGNKDKRKKSNNDGDFIMFEEMIELAKKQDTDIIFISNDYKKGDVISKETNDFHSDISNYFNDRSKKRITFIKVQDWISYLLYSGETSLVEEIEKIILSEDLYEVFNNKDLEAGYEVNETELYYYFINNHYNIEADSVSDVEFYGLNSIEVISGNFLEIYSDEIEIEFELKINIDLKVSSVIEYSAKEDGIPFGRYDASMDYTQNIIVSLDKDTLQKFQVDPTELTEEQVKSWYINLITESDFYYESNDFDSAEISFGKNLYDDEDPYELDEELDWI